MRAKVRLSIALGFFSVGMFLPAWAADRPAGRESVVEAYGMLPLVFEANEGQTDGRVDFLARGSGYTLFLDSTEAVLSLRKGRAPRSAEARPDSPANPTAVLRMRLVGANPAAVATAERPLPGKTNYFKGNDPAAWRTGVPTYGEVLYRDVYPGIDIVYYGNQRRLEHDFIVARGADPNAIRVQFDGIESMALDGAGNLVLTAGGGEVRLERPRLYQETPEGQEEISGGYVMAGARTITFHIGEYDPTRPLVIDPILVYSTFLGGSASELAYDVDVDSLDQAHVTGFTQSVDFPTANASDPSFNGGGDAPGGDAFVTKLDATGTSAIYSTYLGGLNDDQGYGIALDPAGNAYVAGGTRSPNFPITSGAADVTCGGCAPFPQAGDAFVTKLDGAGAIVYSTFLGGTSYEQASGIAVDSLGNAYITGGIANGATTCNFPVVNAYDTCANSYYDAFITKVNATGTAFLYSTTFGGSNDEYCGCDIEVDDAGNVYVAGMTRSLNFPVSAGAYDAVCGTSSTQHVGIFDATATKINTNAGGAASLVYSTCIGGTSDETGVGIATDSTGKIWLTGNGSSTNFPTVNPYDGTAGGGGDAFVVKLDPSVAGAAQLIYGSYLGGSGADGGSDVLVDLTGDIYVVGSTSSSDFPAVDALQLHQGGNDAFVARLNPTLAGAAQLLFSTYLGGCGEDSARRVEQDAAGNVYVVGATRSESFPTTPGVYQGLYGGNSDGYIAKISASGSTVPLEGGCPDDGDACNGPETCDPATGECVSGPPVICNDDGNLCNGPESCDPETGECVSGPPADARTPCGLPFDTACDHPDTCDGAGTCQTNYEMNGNACDDEDPLTCPDSCSEGTCLGSSPVEPAEINDSVRLARTPTDATISWSDAPGPYNVYRGSKLDASPWAYNQVCFDDASGMSSVDTSIPSPGEFFYYLVSRKDQCGESVIGRDSTGQEIPNDSPCSP